MHHQFEHANDKAYQAVARRCDFDPFEFGTVGAECNILKWTKFAPSDIRLMTHDLDFDPVTFDYKYTGLARPRQRQQHPALHQSRSLRAAGRQLLEQQRGRADHDTASDGYWMDKASPGPGNWDIDLRDSRFDATAADRAVAVGHHRDNATTVLFIR